MRGVRDHDLPALVVLAAVREVRVHEHEPRQLALRAGRRLQRHGVEPGDLGEDLLEPPHQLERALRAVLFLVRVEVREAGECDEAEHCSGTSASCPPDGKKTGVCRPKAGACDVAESCDGMTDRCPTDGFEPDGTACDDRNACTTRDTCQAGACAGGPPRDCDDDNPCTDDRCDPATGCSHAANTAPCDDSNACTQADICRDGACAGTDVVCPDSDVCDGIDACDPNTGNCLAGAPPDCDDGVVCTADACDPVNGCTHTPIRGCCRADGDCDDHDVCTGTETCDVATGMCQAGGPLDCDDRDGCTVDGCEAAGGCTHQPIPACCKTDTDCDDHDPCTIRDFCEEADHGGGPDGSPRVCHHDVRACSDDDVCDGEETCDPATGHCAAGQPLDCDDGVTCTADACDPVNGCTHTPIPGCCRKDDDCEDHDACTGIETCDVATGTCRAGAHLDCDDDDACTEDRCDAAQGCLHTENTAGCDDGNPCTADGCNAKRGCVHTPVPGCCRSDADCLDQDACNGDETCVNFACVAGTRLRCDDDDPGIQI